MQTNTQNKLISKQFRKIKILDISSKEDKISKSIQGYIKEAIFFAFID